MQGNISGKITDFDRLVEYQNQLVANEANIRKTADEKLEEKIDNFQRNEFSGSYNDLRDKPVIYDKLADLKDDDLHRTVSDEEKASWNAKSDFSGSYNDLSGKPEIPSIEGLASETYVNEKVSQITEMSPDTIEVIDKLSGMIESDPDFVTNMGNKADSDLSNVSNENFKNKIEESGYTVEIPEVTKESIGLGNVDNTADVDKPVSAAQQAALNDKADKNLSNVSNENFKNKIEESGYTVEIPEVTKESIGLGNVDNTADVDKPVSVPQQWALDNKVNVDLSNVDNDTFKAKARQADVGGTPIVIATTDDRVRFVATVEGITSLYNGLELIVIPEESNVNTDDVTLNVNGFGDYLLQMRFSNISCLPARPLTESWFCGGRPARIIFDAQDKVWVTEATIDNNKADVDLSNVSNEDFKNKIEESGYTVAVPVYTSDLENDSGFITNEDIAGLMSGAAQFTLLWKNALPSQHYSSGTINISNLSNGEAFDLLIITSKNAATCILARGTGSMIRMLYDSSYSKQYFRDMTWDDTTLSIGALYYRIAASDDNYSVANNYAYCVPYQIYGVKL